MDLDNVMYVLTLCHDCVTNQILILGKDHKVRESLHIRVIFGPIS